MNDLQSYFEANTGRRISKWAHYFEIYERHLSRFRGSDVHVVEVGVAHGGSLQMWKSYFGGQARITGVDVNPRCKALEEERVQVFIGDQADRKFLQHLADQVPRIDILIDDGGHFMEGQISTFEVLFPRIAPQGVYVCEDLHTSYWREGYNGGLRRRGTFIEHSKRLVDTLNEWHYQEPVSDLARTMHSLHFYDSVLVVEKRPMSPPRQVDSGAQEIEPYLPPVPLLRKVRNRLRKMMP